MDAIQRLKDIAISDSGFLFDPNTGLTFSVNQTGKFILFQLREGADPEAIEAALRDEFEIWDGDDPQRDVREFLSMLRDQGILPREPQPTFADAADAAATDKGKSNGNGNGATSSR